MAYHGTSRCRTCIRLRHPLHETRVDSSRDEFIPATIEMNSPVYMTAETRRDELKSRPGMKFQLAFSSRDEISSRDEMHIANVILTSSHLLEWGIMI